MQDQALGFERKDCVGVVNINCSQNDQETLRRLSDGLGELCYEITCDEEIRVIVFISNEGRFFSMETSPSGPLMELNEEEIKFWSIADPIANIDVPVIVMINGDAIGQGLELALACDIRIASETSRFGFPHIKRGLIPCDGGTQRLSRLVGRGKALEMVLTGEIVDAQEAYRIGLLNKVFSSEELLSEVMNLAKEIASKGPIALKYAKEAINKGMDMTLKQGLRLESDLYCLLHGTGDRTEGIEAFRKKRTPRFEGK